MCGSHVAGCRVAIRRRSRPRVVDGRRACARRQTTIRRTSGKPRDRVVDDRLEVDGFAAPIGHVGARSARSAPASSIAVAQRRRAEAGIDDRCDRADPRARQHRDDALRSKAACRCRRGRRPRPRRARSAFARRHTRASNSAYVIVSLGAVFADEIVGHGVGLRAHVPVEARHGRVQPAVREPMRIVDRPGERRRAARDPTRSTRALRATSRTGPLARRRRTRAARRSGTTRSRVPAPERVRRSRAALRC